VYITYEGSVFDFADRTTGASHRAAEVSNVLTNFEYIIRAWS
jgi:hypothetical protein